MNDWDRWVLLLIGTGAAIQVGIAGWRLWKQQQRLAAVGDFLLALIAVSVPAVFIFLVE